MQPHPASLLAGVVFSVVLYGALLGLAWRLLVWHGTPQSVPIPLTPVPRGRSGVVARLVLETVAFRSLARASPVTWFASIAMHYGLLVVLLVHVRLLLPVLPAWMVPVLQLSGPATLLLVAGTVALALRRILVDRLRWISVPSDHLHLVLLLAIALSGTALKRLWPTDLYATGRFVRGALSFDWQRLPGDVGLWLHLALAALLIGIFPISKLVHGPGVWFAPTWNTRGRR